MALRATSYRWACVSLIWRTVTSADVPGVEDRCREAMSKQEVMVKLTRAAIDRTITILLFMINQYIMPKDYYITLKLISLEAVMLIGPVDGRKCEACQI